MQESLGAERGWGLAADLDRSGVAFPQATPLDSPMMSMPRVTKSMGVKANVSRWRVFGALEGFACLCFLGEDACPCELMGSVEVVASVGAIMVIAVRTPQITGL